VKFGNDVEFRQEIAKKHRYFGLLRDLAKAIKHARLEQGKPGIRDSGALTSRGIAWGEAGFGCGRFGGVKQVVVTDNDGTLHFVECLVQNSVTLLDGYAVQLGLIDRPSTVQD
jgi:hypothetical protein